MDIVILPIGLASLVGLVLIISILAITYVKKWMMTYGIIIANFFVFVLTVLFRNEIIYGANDLLIIEYAGLAFKPIYLHPSLLPQVYTLFSSMFIHSVSNPLHLLANMLIFFFVGFSFEQRIGPKKLLVIYLISGVVGSLTHALIDLESAVPLIGASGAIFGIMGAFAFSYPRDEVVMPIPLGFFMILRRIKVIYAVLIFAVIETIMVFLGVEDSTAHFAHIGGLIGGVILAAMLIRRKPADQTNPTKTLYYDSFAPQRLRSLEMNSLRELATTPELRDMLRRIEQETVPQVRDVWLEHFLEKTVCPTCKGPLKHFDGKIWCDNCDYTSKY